MKSTKKNRRAGHPLNQFLLQHMQQQRSRAMQAGRENQAFAFKKVVNSLELYPVPLICEQQCQMLEGVGSKISATLTKLIHKKYREYRTDRPDEQDSLKSLELID